MKWVLLAPLVVGGCLLENPEFQGGTGDVGTSGGPGTSSGPGTNSGPATTGDATSSDGSGSASQGWGSSSVATTEEPGGSSSTTDSTTDAAFDPMTLKAYDSASCGRGLGCFGKMQQILPAEIAGFECFTAPVAPPFVLTRVGFEVRFIRGTPAARLVVTPFDQGAMLPGGPAIALVELGPVDQVAYRSFDLAQPVLVDQQHFCVGIQGGDHDATTLSLRTDEVTMAPGEAFASMSSMYPECQTPLSDARVVFGSSYVHYCIDADIAPP